MRIEPIETLGLLQLICQSSTCNALARFSMSSQYVFGVRRIFARSACKMSRAQVVSTHRLVSTMVNPTLQDPVRERTTWD